MSLESELRDALHAQLDTVLDAAGDRDGRKVIHDLIEEAEHGMVISVSVLTRTPADVPAGP